jgi:hypothetical protein
MADYIIKEKQQLHQIKMTNVGTVKDELLYSTLMQVLMTEECVKKGVPYSTAKLGFLEKTKG